LGHPDTAIGDGTFLFSAPSSAHWVARRYGTPTLTVIYDNRGWRAPKQSTLGVHPSGAAAANDDFHVSFEIGPRRGTRRPLGRGSRPPPQGPRPRRPTTPIGNSG
jgi:Thiamine pyrophosphate enzyme, C-terminal TPP binding domain